MTASLYGKISFTGRWDTVSLCEATRPIPPTSPKEQKTSFHPLTILVVAVGDSYNDMEMLAAAGFSVAMGNGEEEVKAQTDFITGSNDCDGLADVVSKILKYAEKGVK